MLKDIKTSKSNKKQGHNIIEPDKCDDKKRLLGITNEQTDLSLIFLICISQCQRPFSTGQQYTAVQKSGWQLRETAVPV